MTNKKKQIPLRISQEIYDDLAAWADSEFRSINGQIEYILNEAIKKHKKLKKDKDNEE